VSKNSFSGRDPALHGFGNCSHIFSNMLRFPKRRAPRSDGLMLVFQHPVKLRSMGKKKALPG